jgi:hypothetical protein
VRIITSVVPPVIHPTSNCSWGWRWVVCRGAGGRFLLFGCASVGVGAGIVAGSSWWGPGAHSSSSSVPAIIHLPYPTCKQVLAAVGTGGGLAFSVSGGLSASVTWRTYGVCWVLTERVSPSWGLPGSLCALLACVDSLTSHLNGEGIGWLCVCCESWGVFRDFTQPEHE